MDDCTLQIKNNKSWGREYDFQNSHIIIFKYPILNKKSQTYKNIGKVWLIERNKINGHKSSWESLHIHVIRQKFKSSVLNMFKGLVETMVKELKENK